MDVRNAAADVTYFHFDHDVNATLNLTERPPQEGAALPLETVITITMEAVLMVTIIVENSLILVAFCYNPKLHQNITNYYLMQLALADFLTGVFTALHITVQVHPALLHNRYACLARFCTMMMVCSMSLLSLLLITYDRFVAIVKPFYYRSHAGKRRVLLKFVIIDAIPLIACLIVPLVWRPELLPQEQCLMVTVFPKPFLAWILIPSYLLLTAVKFVMYLIIFYHIRKRYDRAKKMCQMGSVKSRFQLQQITKSNMALTKTGAIVLVSFIACWLPFFIPLMMQVYGGSTFKCADIISLTTFILILFNSALNPVIYVWRLPFFRRELKKVFCGDSLRKATTDSFANNQSFNSSQVSGRGIANFIKTQTLLHRARRGSGLNDARRISGESLLSTKHKSDEFVDVGNFFYGLYKHHPHCVYGSVRQTKACPPVSSVAVIPEVVDDNPYEQAGTNCLSHL